MNEEIKKRINKLIGDLSNSFAQLNHGMGYDHTARCFYSGATHEKVWAAIQLKERARVYNELELENSYLKGACAELNFPGAQEHARLEGQYCARKEKAEKELKELLDETE